jgi:hypothetical protein
MPTPPPQLRGSAVPFPGNLPPGVEFKAFPAGAVPADGQPIVIEKLGGPNPKQMPPFTGIIGQPPPDSAKKRIQIEASAPKPKAAPQNGAKPAAVPAAGQSAAAPKSSVKETKTPAQKSATATPPTVSTGGRMTFVITCKINAQAKDLVPETKTAAKSEEKKKGDAADED